ncbi:MAG: hypothetical protein PHV93_03950 [Candidatus Pacebacteria bacterium]|nr:hypothetical protein [Candidatus Paceibacterota bacterium]
MALKLSMMFVGQEETGPVVDVRGKKVRVREILERNSIFCVQANSRLQATRILRSCSDFDVIIVAAKPGDNTELPRFVRWLRERSEGWIFVSSYSWRMAHVLVDEGADDVCIATEKHLYMLVYETLRDWRGEKYSREKKTRGASFPLLRVAGL